MWLFQFNKLLMHSHGNVYVTICTFTFPTCLSVQHLSLLTLIQQQQHATMTDFHFIQYVIYIKFIQKLYSMLRFNTESGHCYFVTTTHSTEQVKTMRNHTRRNLNSYSRIGRPPVLGFSHDTVYSNGRELLWPDVSTSGYGTATNINDISQNMWAIKSKDFKVLY